RSAGRVGDDRRARAARGRAALPRLRAAPLPHELRARSPRARARALRGAARARSRRAAVARGAADHGPPAGRRRPAARLARLAQLAGVEPDSTQWSPSARHTMPKRLPATSFAAAPCESAAPVIAHVSSPTVTEVDESCDTSPIAVRTAGFVTGGTVVCTIVAPDSTKRPPSGRQTIPTVAPSESFAAAAVESGAGVIAQVR